MPALGSFHCWCCREIFPSLHRHVHHKVPRSVGGPDTPENLVELCPGCHDALHNVAYKLLSPKISQAQIQDQLLLLYKDNSQAQKTCFELAKHVRNSILVERESGKDPDQLVSLSTSIRKRHKDLIAVYCREKRVSQEEYLRNLVLRHLATMHQLDVVGEIQLLKTLKKRPT